MSFLQSVIADARPRQLMRSPLNGPSSITGWRSRALEGNDFGVEQKSPSAAEPTSRVSTSLSNRESASDVNMGDAPAFKVDNPLNPATQDIGGSVELESPLLEPMDKSEMIANEESSIRLDPVNNPEHQLDSEGDKTSKAEGSITPQPVDTVIAGSRMNFSMSQSHDPPITFPETHGAQHRGSDHEGVELVSFPASRRDTSAQEEVAGVTAVDDQRYSDALIKDAETHTTQADATQIAAFFLPEKIRQKESTELEATMLPSGYFPDSSGNPRSDNATGGDEVEKALAASGKARQAPPPAEKQAELQGGLANQEGILQRQRPGGSKGVDRDVQLVSRKAMAMVSQGVSDLKHASILQSEDKAVQASASSPDSVFSKSGNSKQPIVRPPSPSASPEAFRSVTARPFHADSMPKAGNTFPARPPLRSSEKRPAAPKVQIGQVDVIIEAAAPPVTNQAPATSPIDLSSRYYLRRL